MKTGRRLLLIACLFCAGASWAKAESPTNAFSRPAVGEGTKIAELPDGTPIDNISAQQPNIFSRMANGVASGTKSLYHKATNVFTTKKTTTKAAVRAPSGTHKRVVSGVDSGKAKSSGGDDQIRTVGDFMNQPRLDLQR